MPKYSIILPNYKTEYYLEECLMSVKNQSYLDFECILVDDGSPGITNQEAKAFEPNSIYTNKLDLSKIDQSLQAQKIFNFCVGDDKRFRYITKPNGGQSEARNKGLEIATGDYILFLDCDDYYLPNHIELIDNELLPYSLDQLENSIFYFKDFQKFQIKDQSIILSEGPTIQQKSKNLNLSTNLVYNQLGSTYAVIHSKNFVNTKFRPLTKTMEDVDIINRMMIFNPRIKAIEIDITNSIMHRIHFNSITTNDALNGSTKEALDFVNMFQDYYNNYDLSFQNKLICLIGIQRFKHNPNDNKVFKYYKKLNTLMAKIVANWWGI